MAISQNGHLLDWSGHLPTIQPRFLTILKRLGPGQLGPGQLGPRQLGPRQLGTRTARPCSQGTIFEIYVKFNILDSIVICVPNI